MSTAARSIKSRSKNSDRSSGSGNRSGDYWRGLRDKWKGKESGPSGSLRLVSSSRGGSVNTGGGPGGSTAARTETGSSTGSGGTGTGSGTGSKWDTLVDDPYGQEPDGEFNSSDEKEKWYEHIDWENVIAVAKDLKSAKAEIQDALTQSPTETFIDLGKAAFHLGFGLASGWEGEYERPTDISAAGGAYVVGVYLGGITRQGFNWVTTGHTWSSS